MIERGSRAPIGPQSKHRTEVLRSMTVRRRKIIRSGRQTQLECTSLLEFPDC
jgi:hypothetical protein